jgi:hypothetical protein
MMGRRRSLSSRLHRAARFTPGVEAVTAGRPARRQPRAEVAGVRELVHKTRERRAARRGRDAGDASPTCGRRSSTASATPRTSTRFASSCSGCSRRSTTNPLAPPTRGSTTLSGACPPRNCPERCSCRDSARAGPLSPAASSARTFCRSNIPCANVCRHSRRDQVSRPVQAPFPDDWFRRSASADADTSLADGGSERPAPGSYCFWRERRWGAAGRAIAGQLWRSRPDERASSVSTLVLGTQRLRHSAVLGAPRHLSIDRRFGNL